MQAKCPYCQTGCEECTGGYFEVSLADGAYYRKTCTQCEFESGGRITGPGLPPIEDTLGDPMSCVLCDAPTEYRFAGVIQEGKIVSVEPVDEK